MDYPIKPVPFTNVQFTDFFWQPRIETNRVTTIPLALKKTVPAVTYLDAARHKNLNLKNAPKVKPHRFHTSDLYKALSILDEYEPENSSDGHVSRCTFWPHKGTEEWLQINFPEKRKVVIVSVYWFDDTPSGGCKVPESWELEFKENDKWKKFPIYVTDDYRDFKDQYNVIHAGKDFETDTLRIKIKLQKGFSGGIIKCIIE